MVWRPLRPDRATSLGDARQQLHHAAQLLASLGISYLPKQADDSHTNMQWFAGCLASNLVGDAEPFRLGVRPHPFELVVLGGDAELASFTLHRRTVDEAAEWVRTQVSRRGLDPRRYTLARHYTIPDHPVAHGTPFDATDTEAFDELGRWYGDSSISIEPFSTPDAPVRCWPHHFDIATLITVSSGKTISLGMTPGDGSYDEPYWYASVYPSISIEPSSHPLLGGGRWHTAGWAGAVLPGSRMSPDGDAQRAQAADFLRSAVEACTTMLAG